ncbi:MAG: ATP-binding protein [Pirellulaceae bacterium]
MSDTSQFDYTIQSELAESSRIQEEIMALLRQLGFEDEDLADLHIAIEEGLANAIKHGNQLDASKKVKIEGMVDGNKVRIEIEDEGEGFNPDDVPDPTLDENLDKPSGRGILLMRAFMDTIEYNDKGNRLRIVKSCAAQE